jgi:hypothetical protein
MYDPFPLILVAFPESTLVALVTVPFVLKMAVGRTVLEDGA